MGDMTIEDIIFDLYLTMRYKGYSKLTLYVDEGMELQNVSTYEIPLPERSKNAFLRKNIVDLEGIIDLIGNKRKVNALSGYGVKAQSDTKGAILTWWINYNMTHGRQPLWGVVLERI